MDQRLCVPLDQRYYALWIKGLHVFHVILDHNIQKQGYIYLYPSFQGYIGFVSLLFPLIRPLKVLHIGLYYELLLLLPNF